MKKLLLLPILALSISTTLTPIAEAKDKKDKKDKHDDWKDYYKSIRDDLNGLRDHRDKVRDRIKYSGGDRRLWGQLQGITSDIDRLSYRVDRGDIDPREVRGRIAQLHDSLRGLQDQIGRGGDWRGGDYHRDWRY